MSRVKDFINWNEYENIVIFGCGEWGGLCLNILEKNNIKPVAFCDNDKNKQGTKLKDLMIYSLDEINRKFENPIFIIAIYNCGEIILQLIKSQKNWSCFRNYQDEFIISNKFPAVNRNIFSIFDNYESDILYCQSLDLVITEKCSLKCKDCSNLMQYYEKPINYNKEDIFLYIDRVCELFDLIFELKIIGGEPFVNKDIYDIIDYASSKSNIICVGIWSNATIPINEEKFSKVDKSKLYFNITDYNQLSRNLTQNLNLLEKYQVNSMVKRIDMWMDCSEIKFIERTEIELENVYNCCCVKNYITIVDGKFFLCPFVANIYNLKAMPENDIEYIDILKDNKDEIRKNIKDDLYLKKYINACKYCRGRNLQDERNLVPAVQTKEVLPYKKY